MASLSSAIYGCLDWFGNLSKKPLSDNEIDNRLKAARVVLGEEHGATVPGETAFWRLRGRRSNCYPLDLSRPGLSGPTHHAALAAGELGRPPHLIFIDCFSNN